MLVMIHADDSDGGSGDDDDSDDMPPDGGAYTLECFLVFRKCGNARTLGTWILRARAELAPPLQDVVGSAWLGTAWPTCVRRVSDRHDTYMYLRRQTFLFLAM